MGQGICRLARPISIFAAPLLRLANARASARRSSIGRAADMARRSARCERALGERGVTDIPLQAATEPASVP